MKIGLDLEIKARFENSMSKYVLISIQISRFAFIRKSPDLVRFYLPAGSSATKVSFKVLRLFWNVWSSSGTTRNA